VVYSLYMPAPISFHQSMQLRLKPYEAAVQLTFQLSRDPIIRPEEQGKVYNSEQWYEKSHCTNMVTLAIEML